MASQAIRVVASNQTELITTKKTVRRTIFFSYETPVVITYVYDCGVSVTYVTNKKHSSTTSRHINKYLEASPYKGAESVSQGEIYRLSDVIRREEASDD